MLAPGSDLATVGVLPPTLRFEDRTAGERNRARNMTRPIPGREIRGLIQVAGVIDRKEAEMLLAEGVMWLGFPLRLAVHREDLDETEAAAIIRDLPLGAHGVLITYLDRAADIVSLCDRLGSDAVQIHGDIPTPELARLRQLRPKWFLFKSLVLGRHPLSRLFGLLDEFSDLVDAFITDTFDPETGACGATGKTHDWSLSQALVEASPRPVILAGGLHPGNVAEAIIRVRPAGVDAHTGLENSTGRKDRDRVRRFVEEAHRGFLCLEEG